MSFDFPFAIYCVLLFDPACISLELLLKLKAIVAVMDVRQLRLLPISA
jgi:hypothetical protein